MIKKEMIAMLLAGGQGSRLGVLTSKVAKPAVAFGGKYRIIDFPLSNCINSGVDTVGVLTQYQPLRLNQHIGIGIPWDLDKKNGGVTILAPHVKTGDSGEWFNGTANAIYQNIDFIDSNNPEYVLILSGDHIYKMDYEVMLDFHKQNGSECTIAVMPVPMEEAKRFGIMITDENKRIVDFEEKPANPRSNLASMGIYIFNWKTLKQALIDAGIGIRTIKKHLKEHNIPFENIVGLCITHDHADHIKSAGCLGEKYFIPVYTTKEILAGMNRSYCMTEKIYTACHPICKEVPFEIRDFKITSFEVPHDGTDNVGYFIEYGDRKFAFATDLGHIPPGVAHYLRKANYLVIEANYDIEMLTHGTYPPHLKQRIINPNGHMSNADTAEFLARNFTEDMRYIFLCHLSRENNHPELAYKTVEYRLYQEGIRVGKDVQLVALKRNHPSEYYNFE